MSEEQTAGPELPATQTGDEETIDNTVDPGVTAVVENTPVLPIEKPRKRHQVLWGIAAILIIAFLLFAGWLMLFKHI